MVPATAAGPESGRRSRPLGVLVGRKLEYVQLGHSIALGFSGGCRVLIETITHLDGPGGRTDVEPGDNPDDIMATLLGETVRSAGSAADGELCIDFGSGARLVVDVDPDAESWAVVGPGGYLIVCLARGELASWGEAARR
ncbi:DUF6188 family protein [Actinoplanes derwentensis]|uniref:Uncharacterized protein n=1 Tax=Actinoplanes derwentensis TaxID=113562 RepID=A0A1H1YVH3_9ACTN|nr:DUF6188 family protein [Actinoplanes derwentensis]GID81305.1 hypothetical protein Ade03nite_02290 [Actinoplanes derwentensis]SDT25319.1 hypothetical protein SAMN04489716_3013 [Actinoplanes derwentensis]